MKLHFLTFALLSALALPAFGQSYDCESTADEPLTVDELAACTAIGVGARAGIEGTAIGPDSTAVSGVAVGVESNASNGVAIGNRAWTQNGVAVGNETYSYHSVVIGDNAYGSGNPSNTGIQSTVVGQGARGITPFYATQGAVAVGDAAEADGDGNVAIGSAATAKSSEVDPSMVSNATAIGARAVADYSNSVSLGADSQTNNGDQVSVGNATLKRQIVNVAAGTQDDHVVIVDQLKPIAQALGGNANMIGGMFQLPSYLFLSGAVYNNVGSALSDLDGRVYNLETNPPGQGPAGADGASAYEVAVSEGFQGNQEEWLASLKGETGDTGPQGPAGQDGQDGQDGSGTGVEGPQGPQGPAGQDGQDGSNGLAGEQGDSAYEVAVSEGFEGNRTEWLESLKGRDGMDGNSRYFRASGKEDGSDDAQVNAGRAVAAGANASVNAEGGTAVGDGARVEAGATNSLALGANSVATAPNTVSVGSAGHERRITNVAPGRIAQGSTDAVNGGQIWDLEDRWSDRFERTDKRVDGLGAQLGAMTNMVGAAAANGAAVGEVQFNAGIGFSGNQAALAIGWSSRISPRVSVSGGMSFGTGNKPVGGMGISVNLGR